MISKGIIAGLSLLFFGTISSVLSKIQLLIQSTGFIGIQHYFEKPGIQVFSMFLGMALAYPVFSRQNKGERKFTGKEYVMPVVSSICGSSATYIMIIGLSRINVSIYTMIRGGLTIFSTLFRLFVLKKPTTPEQWHGIGLLIIALVIVGIAGVQIESSSRYSWVDRLIGILVVFVAQIVQGGQLVYDEYMAQHLKLPVMFLVGMEGIWGLAITVLIIFPLSYIIPGNDPSGMGGSLENTWDSILMLAHSWALSLIFVVSTLAICCYDISGMTVTGTLSSIHRTVFESLRTLTSWAVMLIIGWCGGSFGEHWVTWSWLELVGYVLLITSTFVFHGAIPIPWLNNSKKENVLN